MTKFYIATSLSRHQEHNLVRDQLIKKGWSITYDWTLHGSVKETSEERLAEVAQNMYQGIIEADVVIILLPGGKGTHTELGMAIAHNKSIFIHSETETPFTLGEETLAFYYLPQLLNVVCELPGFHELLTEIINTEFFAQKQACLIED